MHGIEMPSVRRVRMSYEEWRALPDAPKSEWVAGEAIVNAPASADHMDASYRLATVLKRDLPMLHTYMEVGVVLPRDTVRVPDVMAVTERPDGFAVTEPPVLVAEVLSPSTRGEDTVRKSADYLAGGVGQYWVVDPAEPSIEVYSAAGAGWDLVVRLDTRHPAATVEVPPHGTVHLDLEELTPR